jgi:hypothetical protein
LFQLIDMTPGEIQWLSNHLGHDFATHKSNYRMHAPAIEITTVGKLLPSIDRNDAAFAGKQMKTLLHKGTMCFIIKSMQLNFVAQ